jgi:hypothetical protein
MDNAEGCSYNGMRAHALRIGGLNALHGMSSRFASYLRAFGNFFQLHTTILAAETAKLPGICFEQFPVATASVAFV